jgi:3-oxoacyl-[acyl-carrier protein] reductase
MPNRWENFEMDLGLAGKVAFVTGASQGIGEGIARALHAQGAKVALIARGREKLGRLASALGDGAFPVSCDVTDDASVTSAVKTVTAEVGPIDIAVNNAAGIATDGEAFRPFANVSSADWLETYNMTVVSAVRVARAVLPGMTERRWGRIINISSESGEQPDPMGIEYAAAKGALNTFGKALSKAYGAYGVLVNTVSPAYVDTPILRTLLSQQEGGDKIPPETLAAHFLAGFRPGIVVGRPGQPADIGAVVAFLASEAASFVTGANWRVDGGSVGSI